MGLGTMQKFTSNNHSKSLIKMWGVEKYVKYVQEKYKFHIILLKIFMFGVWLFIVWAVLMFAYIILRILVGV